MHSFLLGVLLLPAVAFSQPVTVDKTIICSTVDNVMSELTKKYGEQPIWFGKSNDSKVGLFVNPKTQSWSVVQFNEKIACVLENGEEFQIRKDFFGGKSVKL